MGVLCLKYVHGVWLAQMIDGVLSDEEKWSSLLSGTLRRMTYCQPPYPVITLALPARGGILMVAVSEQ